MAAADAAEPAAARPGPSRGYRYREDVAIADVAFEAWGATLEELFVAAADATVNTMAARIEEIEGKERRAINVQERAADLLLYRFLEEIIFFKDAEGLLLRVPAVRIREDGGVLSLEAEARGEALDGRRHRLQADVKAVTLHLLRVEPTARGWEAFVVLDV